LASEKAMFFGKTSTLFFVCSVVAT
jgi:hypothetical protein